MTSVLRSLVNTLGLSTNGPDLRRDMRRTKPPWSAIYKRFSMLAPDAEVEQVGGRTSGVGGRRSEVGGRRVEVGGRRSGVGGRGFKGKKVKFVNRDVDRFQIDGLILARLLVRPDAVDLLRRVRRREL